jgi:uncharacterized protein
MTSPSSSGGAWKPSVFNVFEQRNGDGRCHCFNSRSGAFFTLRDAEYDLVRRCLDEVASDGRCSIEEMQEMLVRSSLVAPGEVDERALEHRHFLDTKASEAWAFLSIVPTFACNLRCGYCYQESVRRQPRMSQAVMAAVVELFAEMAERAEGISVYWFGGEPLLALDSIEWLSERFQRICRERGRRYQPGMITNGSLLSTEAIRRMGLLGLRRLEISLDGLPETYGRRKGLPINRARAFYDFLIAQAGALLESCGALTIHINVDRNNAGEARELVQRFLRESASARKIRFRMQALSGGKGLLDCMPRNCYSATGAVEARAEFNRFLASQGMPSQGLPPRLNHPCMAVRKYAFTIDPAGNVGRCVPATGLAGASFFRIGPPHGGGWLAKLEACRQPYVEFDPFDDPTCGGCRFLPVCLGQCPRDHETGTFVCARRSEFEASLELAGSQASPIGAETIPAGKEVS